MGVFIILIHKKDSLDKNKKIHKKDSYTSQMNNVFISNSVLLNYQNLIRKENVGFIWDACNKKN